jgi:hypothetical protein
MAQDEVFPSEEELFRIKNDKGYTARIDGLFFNARDNNNYTAQLQNTNTVCINFLGNSTKDKSGKFYKQVITLECSLVNDKLTPLRVVYDFAGKKYLGHESDIKLEVAKLEWNASKTGFALTAKLESVVKRPYDDGLMVVMNIKSRMADLDVVVAAPEKTVAEQ